MSRKGIEILQINKITGKVIFDFYKTGESKDEAKAFDD